MQKKLNKFYRLSSARWLLRGGTAALGVFLAVPFATAELKPSLNMYGATGLIDMPSGEAQPDGQLSVTTSHFGPISRNTLSFQISPRISASFRFLGIRDWNKTAACQATSSCTGVDLFDTYYDRSFDLRFKALDESRYLPAVTIGLQDFAGTGILSGEYIAATKSLTPNLKVTAGLGWGRLGSKGDIGSPFGIRPPIVVGSGGDFNVKQWFKGPAAPFGGIEWQVNDQWTVKGEYSSDAYAEEAGRRNTFQRKSSFNFGVEYQPSDMYRLGAYYMYGNTVGVAGQFFINPKKRPMGGVSEGAPVPVKLRPSRSSDPDAWSQEWITQEDAGPVLRGNVEKQLKDDGIIVESIGYSAGKVQVRIRNTRYTNNAEAIGRTARALSKSMPASVEVFDIVPVVNGVPASVVTVRRSDMEALEFSPDAIAQMRDRTKVSSGAHSDVPLQFDESAYPKFTWFFSPYLATSYFDPSSPVRADLKLRLSGRYEMAPGIVLDGSVTQKLLGNVSKTPHTSNSVLQHVRTDGPLYAKEGTTALERLTLSYYNRPAENLYARVSAGYLEPMFGGVSTELLWKQPDSPLALGVEVNYARQREFSQGLGFQSYGLMTGHVSAYYQFNNGYNAQLDVGRYLAGDVGATLSLEREFANGIVVGAFATKTNVSAADFGEGSFDKGIKVKIPFGWGLGKPSKSAFSTTIRPLTRDGGARLDVQGRLYEGVKGYHKQSLDAQFGRFWK